METLMQEKALGYGVIAELWKVNHRYSVQVWRMNKDSKFCLDTSVSKPFHQYPDALHHFTGITA